MARQIARGSRLRPGPACKGGRRRPQGATDTSSLQATARRGNSMQGRRLWAEAPARSQSI
ncbi:hypothetical protein B296_00035704, partial [Ensete ventricosum]